MTLYAKSRKKGVVWYSDFRSHGQRYVHCLGTVTKTQARRLEQVLRAQVIERRYLPREPSPAPLLRDFAQRYYTWYASHHRPRSNRSVKLALESVANHFPAAMTLDEFSPMAIEGYKQAMAHRLAPRTVNFRLHVLMHLLRTAVEWEVLAGDPLQGRKIRRLREPTPPTRVLSEDEETRLLAAVSPHLRPLLIFALHTGLRCGELVGLRWSQIDLTRRTVTVEGHSAKSLRTRVIPLNAAAMAAIGAFPPEGGKDTAVFLTHRGTPYTDNGARSTLAFTVHRLGLQGVSLHTLRHSFASRLLEHGATMREVQELLGHASVVQTQRYTHVDQGRLRQAVASLVDPSMHSQASDNL